MKFTTLVKQDSSFHNPLLLDVRMYLNLYIKYDEFPHLYNHEVYKTDVTTLKLPSLQN